LKVCRLYTKPPLPCVSGVTGADVKKRLRSILEGTIAAELSGAKKLALAITGLAALAAPILIGVMTAPVIRAQNPPANTPRFEVASIKPCKEADNGPSPKSSPGRLVEDCHELLNIIGNAYTTFADGHLNLNAEPAPMTGGPPWLHSASYNINAKAEGNPMMLGPMMQRLLEDRFHLKIHRETREGPGLFFSRRSPWAKATPVQVRKLHALGCPATTASTRHTNTARSRLAPDLYRLRWKL
jgi:bla regulator protein blaR1